jgi:EAL domain-containing protein (putative c-di-GMP-specific phosphodiesterase class I)
MHYQPIVNLATSDVVGFEALMRWNHSERGWVPPDVFIPLAEKGDLIIELGDFALREAVAAASGWNLSSGSFIAVNVSARQLVSRGFAPFIETTLAGSGLSPSQLVLEITERAALSDLDATMRTLEHLRRRGVGVALDDFGTGHASLSYLVDLQPTIIKIDKSFVNPKRPSVRNDIVLEMIVALGSNLKVAMIAEGIETPAHLARLRQLGCELGQGYLFSAAVPSSEVPGQLEERRLESIS